MTYSEIMDRIEFISKRHCPINDKEESLLWKAETLYHSNNKKSATEVLETAYSMLLERVIARW